MRRSRYGRFATFSTGGIVALLLLTGCTADPLAEQYREGSGKGYIAADGSVEEFAADQREEPIEFSGPTVDGGEFDSADHAGEVMVVNFWYAGCAPCRAEADDLQAVNETLPDGEAQMVGINLRDQAPTAASFEEKYGTTYPSILDSDSAEAQLAFAGDVPPNAVPTTIVLDRQGRVAARILGQLRDRSILETIVADVLAEAS
jgi:peroxiredoxin